MASPGTPTKAGGIPRSMSLRHVHPENAGVSPRQAWLRTVSSKNLKLPPLSPRTASKRQLAESKLAAAAEAIGSAPPMRTSMYVLVRYVTQVVGRQSETPVSYTQEQLDDIKERLKLAGTEPVESDYDPFAVLTFQEVEVRHPFDEYHYEGLDKEHFLETPYVPPDPVKAMNKRDAQTFRNSHAPYFSTSTESFKSMGAGVYLYFSLLRHLICVLFVGSVILIPTLYFCFTGDRMSIDQRDLFGLTFTTLANNGHRNMTICSSSTSTSGQCVPTTVEFFFTDIFADTASYLMTLSDIAFAVIFLVVMLRFRVHVRRTMVEQARNRVSAASYTVLVRGLPKDAQEDELRDHFSNLFQLVNPDWSTDGCCGLVGEKLPRDPEAISDRGSTYPLPNGKQGVEYHRLYPKPVEDYSNTQNPDYDGSWVAAVALARADGFIIHKFLEAKTALQQVRAARAAVKKFAPGTKWSDPVQYELRMKKLQKMEDKLEALNEVMAKKNDSVVCAFVTFNNEESYVRCLEDYQGSTNPLIRLFQPYALQFRDGLYKLSVEPAPDPSKLLWENLEVGPLSKFCRRVLVWLATVAVLGCGVAAVYFVHQAGHFILHDAVPSASTCVEDLPTQVFGAQTLRQIHAPLLIHNRSMDSTCPEGSFYIRYENAPRTDNECLRPCVEPQDHETCMGDYKGLIPRVLFAKCYCRQRLQRAVFEQGIATGLQDIQDKDEDVCLTVSNGFVFSKLVGIISSYVVVYVNELIEQALKLGAEFECHDSAAVRLKSTAVKMFFAQFLNMALVVLVMNAEMPPSVSFPGSNLLQGTYEDVSIGWYGVVGVELVMALALEGVSAQLKTLVKAAVFHPLRVRRKRATMTTQADMDALYEGPEFTVEAQYPKLLTMVFVTLMYSAGLPLLVPLALGRVLLTYFVDRLMILRYHKIPKAKFENLAEYTAEVAPYALLMHLLMGMWFFGNSQVIDSGPVDFSLLTSKFFPIAELYHALTESTASLDAFGVRQRAQRWTVAPFFIAAMVVVFIMIMQSFIGRMLRALAWRIVLIVWLGRKGFEPLPSEYVKNRNWMPPFCEPFRQHQDPLAKEPLLTAEEAREGWHIERVNGIRYKERPWKDTGTIDGVAHISGSLMLSWEVIRTQGLCNYDILANPVYLPAMRAMHEEIARQRRLKGQGARVAV